MKGHKVHELLNCTKLESFDFRAYGQGEKRYSQPFPGIYAVWRNVWRDWNPNAMNFHLDPISYILHFSGKRMKTNRHKRLLP
uniref:Uncharacterized protein n=1 Tax=Anguilla anguilla TaxID=7936 RepID=A0A0E9SDX2_ANGAN